MKKNVAKEIVQRILAVVLSVVMIAGLLPASTLMVFAETPDHKDCVTISVVDEEGKAVEGAEVDYSIISITQQTEVKKEKIVTDNKGTVEILPKEDYVENDMKVIAKISKADYFDENLPSGSEDEIITADNQDIKVVLKSKNIKGVSVTPTVARYTGVGVDAATITGTKAGDKVSYKLDNSDWKELSGESAMVKITEVGTYFLTVRVERQDYYVYETTVRPQITKGIFTVDAEGVNRSYTEGSSYPALVINSGLQEGDSYTCTVNGTTAPANQIPNIEKPGVYSVTLKVNRNNYETFQKTYTTSIKLVEIDGYGAEVYSGVFDGIAHNAVSSVTGNSDGETFQYRMSMASENVEDDVQYPWSDTMPQVKDAGVYSVQIRVVKGDPSATDYVKATFAPAYVVVEKAEQKVEFINKEETLEYSGEEGTPVDYSVSVQGCEYDTGYVASAVEYSVKSTDSSEEIATIDASGMLTVKGAGQIEITAMVAEDAEGNYNPQSASMIVNIVDKSNRKQVTFERESVDFVIGTGDVVSDQAVKKTVDSNKGNITYSAKTEEGVALSDAGLKLEADGKVSLTDISKLAEALENNENNLTVKVQAEIAAYGGIFPKDTTAYVISIAFAEKPQKVYKIVESDTNNEVEPNNDGWYQNVEIIPATEGYTIANSVTDTFRDKIEIADSSDIEQKVYVKNGSSGIVAPESISMKKDATKPSDVSIEISEVSVVKRIRNIIYKFLGKDQKVDITFKAKDVTSGVKEFAWEYNRSEDASNSILEKKSGTVTAVADNESYSASIELPKDVITEDGDQLRGMISVKAVDNAGNESETYTNDGTVIVYDTIAPNIEVAYSFDGDCVHILPDSENPVQYYTSEDAQLAITVKEANFDKDDVAFKIIKDGAEVQVDADKYICEWKDVLIGGKMTDKHILTCTIKADDENHVTDGDYSFIMEYTDASGNQMSRWESERTITIDTIVPELQFKYSNDNYVSLQDKDNKQEVTITINEHNFRASDISLLSMTSKNIEDVDVMSLGEIENYLQDASKWSHNGDVHTLVLTSGKEGTLKDAIYNMTLQYQDLAYNKSDEVSSGSFIVDHTPPTITNNEENLPYKDAIEKAVFKEMVGVLTGAEGYYFYYNSEQEKMVTLEFIATDEVSGVSKFNWKYLKESGASSINLDEAHGEVEVTDSDQVETDKSKFSVKMTLPIKDVVKLAEESSELRGSITFNATDKYQNVSDDYVDNNIIINDTIAPKIIAVEYVFDGYRPDSEQQWYTNNDVTLKITVNEANFDEKDVDFKVKKDEEAVVDEEKYSWQWSDGEKEDEHILTCIIKADSSNHTTDGDYTFTMDYTDVSDNKMKSWASDRTITLDTINPNLSNITYNNSGAANGKLYGNGDFTAEFTIDEKNFDDEDVTVEISKGDQKLNFDDYSYQWTDVEKEDKHILTCTIKADSENHSTDGEYVIKVSYTDKSNNPMVTSTDLSENETLSGDGTYTSPVIVIDTIQPEVEVTYSNKNVINVLDEREYYDDVQIAEIKVNEHNFWYKEGEKTTNDVHYTITAKDASGQDIKLDDVCILSDWSDDTKDPDIHTMTITYPGDANYTFDVEYKDLATNAANYTDTNKDVMKDYHEDKFTVDKTAPTDMKVSYSTSILETALERLSFGFYNAQMTVTISAKDETSGINSFNYSYITAEGVSSVNAQLKNQTIGEDKITYDNGRLIATAEFKVPREALNSKNQFNGTVKFTATDRSGKSSGLADSKRIVVDNISPTSTIEYNAPVQTVEGIAYYDGTINATLTVNEANFYANDVNVSVTKDGGTYSVTPSWTNVNTDVHIGTFALTEDGDYHITVNYSDKSGNAMATYTSEQMTVDTEITAPTITVNGEEANGRAFKDDLVPGVNFEDKNFQDYELTLTRTRLNDKDVDVEEQFVAGNVMTTDQGGNGQFNTFDKIAENDGIYTLSVTMRDKAGHSAQSSATFTANRYGSVYVYDEYLSDLIKDGGAYVQEVEKNIIVTEYNADRLLSGSDNVQISRDGKPVGETDYKVSPVINDQVSVGNSGWYQYEYTISKANFDKDGTYKMSLASEDATGNHPQTENYEDQTILFRVDSTAPEINSIVGLEEKIINAQSVDVKYSVYDTISLESIEVFVNEKSVDKITDFNDDYNNYEGTFKVDEMNSAQTVRLVVTDKAGNVTDTSSENFTPAFSFENKVTISTNAFVRFYANKALFFGSIGGTAAVAVAAGYFIRFRRRKVLDV